MKRKLISIALSVSLISSSFVGVMTYNGEQVEAATQTTYQVTAKTLNVRAGAGTKYKLLGSLKKGTKINVSSQTKNGWLKFTYKGKTAYVSNKYVKKVATTQAKTTASVKTTYKYVVTTEGLNVRSGSGTKYKKIGSLKKGVEISVKSQVSNGWYKINFNGKTGYVSNKYVKKIAISNGKVVELKVPYYSQYSVNAPMGCEASALLQVLHFKGKAKQHNLTSFLKEMPIDPTGNPNKGFGGTPFKVEKGVYQSIFPKPLAEWGSKYGEVVDISGSNVAALKTELNKGNPIVVYVTSNYAAPKYANYFWGKGITNAHVVTLSGYINGYYQVTDPARGKLWVSAKEFEGAYNLKKFAVVVR